MAQRNVLDAGERHRPVFVEDKAGERLTGFDALDDDDRHGVLGVVQYAMNHGNGLEQA